MRKLLRLFLSLLAVAAFSGTIPAQNKPEQNRKLNVAILIFDGVQIIDYTGPYEVFGSIRFNPYTVAEKPDAVKTEWGMSVNPNFAFENQPKPDILVIPGGRVDLHIDNPKIIKWIQDNSKEARYVLSVCNGAFFLAKAGLLDGLEATTTAWLINDLGTDAPKTKMITNKRVVDNGKIITSGGLSAGIEGALHVISKIYGEAAAQDIALGLEYHWDRNSTFLPGTSARKYIAKAQSFKNRLNGRVIDSEGDETLWNYTVAVNTEQSAEDLSKLIDNHLTNFAKWTKNDSGKTDNQSSRWKFTDETGKGWDAAVNIQNDANEKGKWIIKLAVKKEN